MGSGFAFLLVQIVCCLLGVFLCIIGCCWERIPDYIVLFGLLSKALKLDL
jgi:hypothetical protein